jgi:hypothetical protein
MLLFETPGALEGARNRVLPGDGLIALLIPSASAQAGAGQIDVA